MCVAYAYVYTIEGVGLGVQSIRVHTSFGVKVRTFMIGAFVYDRCVRK